MHLGHPVVLQDPQLSLGHRRLRKLADDDDDDEEVVVVEEKGFDKKQEDTSQVRMHQQQ